MKRFGLVFAFLFTFSLLPVKADEGNYMGIPRELDKKIQTALEYLFNMKYDAALQIFNSLKDQSSPHPMVSFGITCSHWWRLSTLVLETDMQESQAFLRTVNDCINASHALIKAGDPTGEGHLVLGGALGLLGRWQVTNRQYVNAYFTGKKAYKYLVKAVGINPKLADANLGKGIFDYYVATLPAIVRILAFLGQGSDRAEGLNELEDAAKNSLYAKTAAKLFLVDIYANLENRPDRSLEILTDLLGQYPFSPFIHTLSFVSHYNNGNIDKLKEEAASFMDRVKKGAYSKDFEAQAHFFAGAALFKEAKFLEAAENFSKAVATNSAKNAFYSWATLYRGYCFDALDQRTEAIRDYKAVLNQLRRWESWDHARQRLGKPFTANDEEMKKLKL